VTDNKSEDIVKMTITRILPGKKWKVLRLLSRIHKFPEYMPNVKQCTVLEKDRQTATTCWNVTVDQFPISWKEKDEFDLANFIIRFKSIEGDLEHFQGRWELKDHEGGCTKVTLYVSAKIGIPGVPLFSDVMGNVVEELLRKNFNHMLDAFDRVLTRSRYKNIANRKISDIKGFAVVGHPYNFQHLVRYFRFFKPDLKLPSKEFVARLFDITPSYKAYDVKKFKSKTGKTVDGCFIMCPIIPDMIHISPERVLDKVIQGCRVAEQLGLGIVVLGGFTSIAGEKYAKALTEAIHIPMTTGNALTVSMVLDGIRKAARLMELDMSRAKVTIIGGTGDIGSAVARSLSKEVHEITITSRSEKNLMDTERTLFYYGKARIKTSRNSNEAVRNADIVLAAASVSASIIDFHNFKPGAIICDVGYPKNISYTDCSRNDIFIFSGGIASLPSEFNLGFDLGLPSPSVLYGCFAEAILLSLEERYENFSWGKGNISKERIDYIREISKKHGFELAPFFWGDRLMTEKAIKQIKEAAKKVIKSAG
jgi:fatty aldehyde-generating acyl-ACP reductase